MKATYIELTETCREDMGVCLNNNECTTQCVKPRIKARSIFKDPVTDDGTKKSAKGLLAVFHNDGGYFLQDGVTKEVEESGELVKVFENSKLLVETNLQEIRKKLKK